MKSKTVWKLPLIDLTKINQVYFGKQGCACGCNGNYHTAVTMKKRAISKLKKHELSGLNIQEGLGEDKSIISLEETNRAVRVYTKQNLLKKEVSA